MGSLKKIYDLYGLETTCLEDARQIVESILDITLCLHESSYIGEYYRLDGFGDEDFVLQRNFDPMEKEWNEPDFIGIPFLLYVSETNRSEEIKAAFEGVQNVRLLRHKEI